MAQNQQLLEQQREQVSRMLDGINPNAPISATTSFDVRSEQRDAFERLAATLVTASPRMAGVSVFDFLMHVSIHPHGNGQYLIYEKWETVSAYREQWNSDAFKKF